MLTDINVVVPNKSSYPETNRVVIVLCCVTTFNVVLYTYVYLMMKSVSTFLISEYPYSKSNIIMIHDSFIIVRKKEVHNHTKHQLTAYFTKW